MEDNNPSRSLVFDDGVNRCINSVLSMLSSGYHLPTVGVAGCSQAGKSAFVSALGAQLQCHNIGTLNLSMDDYYKTKDEISDDSNPDNAGIVNFDVPSAVNLTALMEDISSLKRGEMIPRLTMEYNPANDGFPTAARVRRGEICAANSDVLTVEGLFIHRLPVVEVIDISVFIYQPDSAHRMRARIQRDIEKRMYSETVAIDRWRQFVEPSCKKFIDPINVGSLCRVDLLIVNPY